MKNLVVLGFLGAKLDSTTHEDRWNFWRPTVALGMHEELLIKRFELFYQPNEQALCDCVVDDLNAVSPETEVRPHCMDIDDPWDFEEIYGLLHDFAGSYPFDRPQLAEVISICREAPTLSEAGRMLFDVSRMQKKSSNDADRLRKYLARFELSWETIKASAW